MKTFSLSYRRTYPDSVLWMLNVLNSHLTSQKYSQNVLRKFSRVLIMFSVWSLFLVPRMFRIMFFEDVLKTFGDNIIGLLCLNVLQTMCWIENIVRLLSENIMEHFIEEHSVKYFPETSSEHWRRNVPPVLINHSTRTFYKDWRTLEAKCSTFGKILHYWMVL